MPVAAQLHRGGELTALMKDDADRLCLADDEHLRRMAKAPVKTRTNFKRVAATNLLRLPKSQ